MSFLNRKQKNQIGKLSISVMLFFDRLNNNCTIGRGLFIIYKIILRWVNMSVLPVVNAIVYREKTNNVEIIDIETNRVGITANVLMTGSEEKPVLFEKPLPDLRIKIFKNVCIQGNSDVVVDNNYGFVISEESYNIEENVEIIDGLLYRTQNNICLLRNNLHHRKEHLPSGIMISGKFCNNYYHILYENFIKLIYIDDSIIPKDIPIIIDHKTLEIPSCKTIFDLLTKSAGRLIYTIESNLIYQIDVLYCMDHVNKLPPHLKDPHIPVDALYSPKALCSLREKLLPYKSQNKYSNKIFISRVSTKRRHYNESEVFGTLEKYGFSCVAPENYSFEEQLSLFNNASFIIAATGAALTNLLFVNNNCTVICFGQSTHDKVCDMPYYNTIANLNGALFYYFPRKDDILDNLHVDYEVDCVELENIVKKLLL